MDYETGRINENTDDDFELDEYTFLTNEQLKNYAPKIRTLDHEVLVQMFWNGIRDIKDIPIKERTSYLKLFHELGIDFEKDLDPMNEYSKPLHYACMEGKKGLIVQLIKAGADPNGDEGIEYGYIGCACRYNEDKVFDVIDALVENGYRVSWSDVDFVGNGYCGNDDASRYLRSIYNEQNGTNYGSDDDEDDDEYDDDDE